MEAGRKRFAGLGTKAQSSFVCGGTGSWRVIVDDGAFIKAFCDIIIVSNLMHFNTMPRIVDMLIA